MGGIMRKLLLFVFLLYFQTEAYAVSQNSNKNQVHENITSGKMQNLRIMISKLRELIYNLKDINQLEDIGMPKGDVLLMKTALQEKINQMETETIMYIRRL